MRDHDPEAFSGMAFMIAAVAAAVTNGVFTPLLPRGVPFATTVLSPVFLWREISSAVCALWLLLGLVGLWFRFRDERSGWAVAALITALIGCALLLATEWSQIFDLRDMASIAPATLNALSARRGLQATDVGALLALLAFTAGWIAVAVLILRSRRLPARSAWLLIGGFVAIPLLQLLTRGRAGAIAGNLVLASGWFLLGLDLRAHATPGLSSLSPREHRH